MFLLKQYQLAESQIYGEHASEEAMAAIAAANPNFVAEQRAIYDVVRVQAAARQEVATAEKDIANCASYAPVTNHQPARWDDDSQGATISLVDLTSTGDGQGADSSEDE